MAQFTWGRTYAGRWLWIALAASLTVNLLLIAGYLYQRHVAYPREQVAWAAHALNLNAAQQRELVQLNEWARNEVQAAREQAKPDFVTARAILRDGQAGDPRFAEALRHISEKRLQIQMEAMNKVFAFRDSLSAEQRQAFAQLSAEPQFVLRLLGLAPLRTEFNE